MSDLPTMSRTRDLLITADITVRRSKPTELRGEYFRSKSCLVMPKVEKQTYIYSKNGEDVREFVQLPY